MAPENDSHDPEPKIPISDLILTSLESFVQGCREALARLRSEEGPAPHTDISDKKIWAKVAAKKKNTPMPNNPAMTPESTPPPENNEQYSNWREFLNAMRDRFDIGEIISRWQEFMSEKRRIEDFNNLKVIRGKGRRGGTGPKHPDGSGKENFD